MFCVNFVYSKDGLSGETVDLLSEPVKKFPSHESLLPERHMANVFNVAQSPQKTPASSPHTLVPFIVY